MLIGFLGDTHGNTAAAKFMLWAMHKRGVTTLVQVGDFGIYTDNNGMKFASKVSVDLVKYDQTLIVVPGNHENYRVINEILEDVTTGNRTQFGIYRKRIWIAPRGMRLTFDGMSFLFFGGAPSVDRTWRIAWDIQGKPNAANKNWYSEEALTPEDVKYVSEGGYADVMVCHDAPHGVQGIDRVISGNPHGFKQVDLIYAEAGRNLMTEAFRAVAPELFFHGHYHTPVYEEIQRPGAEWGETTRIIGLDCEFNNYSMAILDTETGDAINIDHRDLLAEYRAELNGQKW